MITLFDITIFTIIVFSTILGVYEGIIGLIARLLGFITSIILSFYLYSYVIEFINSYIQNELVKVILSGIISYIGSLIFCLFITHKLLTILAFIRGGFFDKILGLLAGFFRGAVISIILFLIITVFSVHNFLKVNTLYDLLQNPDSEKYPEWLENSETFSYLNVATRAILGLIPKDTLKSVKFFEQKDIEDSEKEKASLHSS